MFDFFCFKRIVEFDRYVGYIFRSFFRVFRRSLVVGRGWIVVLNSSILEDVYRCFRIKGFMRMKFYNVLFIVVGLVFRIEFSGYLVKN